VSFPSWSNVEEVKELTIYSWKNCRCYLLAINHKIIDLRLVIFAAERGRKDGSFEKTNNMPIIIRTENL
jgi:hypothetical protein